MNTAKKLSESTAAVENAEETSFFDVIENVRKLRMQIPPDFIWGTLSNHDGTGGVVDD